MTLRGSGSSLHPRARLCDVLRDGDEIDVALQTEVAVGSNGEPVLNQWSAQAFCHSEEGASPSSPHIYTFHHHQPIRPGPLPATCPSLHASTNH